MPQLDERRPELFQRVPELPRAFDRRGPVTPDAELTQDAQQAGAPGDTTHVQGTPEPLSPNAHHGRVSPRPQAWKRVGFTR